MRTLRLALTALLLAAPGLAGTSSVLDILPTDLPDGFVGSTIGTTAPNPPDFQVRLITFEAIHDGEPVMADFSVSSGSLPSGVTLSSSGELRGAPTRSGQFSFTIEGRTGQGFTGTRSYSIEVLPPISGILTGRVGDTFAVGLSCFIDGSTEAFDYRLSGNLPPGIEFFNEPAGGSFFGLPTARARRTVTWRCVSSVFQAQINFQIIIEGPRELSFEAPPGVPMDLPFAIPGGTAPFTYSISAGSLPPGVMLAPDEARFTGTPTTPGTYNFVVAKTDFDDFVYSAAVTFIVPGAPLQLSRTQLTLDSVANGPVATGSVEVTGELGSPYQTAVMIENPLRPWLSVAPPTGTLPQVLRIDADPTGLPEGEYVGHIDIGPAGGPTERLTVTLRVGPVQPAELSFNPSGLRFAFAAGASAATKTVQMSNLGSGALPLQQIYTTTDDDGDWLSVTPTSGRIEGGTPVVAAVTADPGALPPGTYSGDVWAATAADAPAENVPVTMTISDQPGVLRLSSNGLSLRAAPGGQTATQTVRVFNEGVGELSWGASASTVSGGDWLEVSGGAGNTPGSFDVDVDASGLSPGLYYGRIRVEAAQAVNSPQTVIVALQVVDEATLGPQPDRRGAVVVVSQGASGGTQVRFRISNPTAVAQDLRVQAGALGITLPEVSLDDLISLNVPGQIGSQGAVDMTLETTAMLGMIPAGFYRGRVQLAFDDGPPASIDVLLVVAPAPLAVPLTAGDGAVAGGGCDPSAIGVVNTAPGEGFEATLGQSTPIEALAVDDCGQLVTDADVAASFSNGDTAVNLTSNGDGSYSGDWNPQDDRENAQVTVDARQRGIQGTVEVGGSLSALAGVPSINTGGAVSAASFSAESPLPPGAFVSVFGSNLAAQTESAAALPFPTEIGGVSLEVAGVPVPLQFVAEGQINAVLPFGMDINAAQQVVVQRGSALSAPENVSVSAAQPAAFTQDLSGQGAAAAVGVRPDGASFLIGPEGSLRPGDFVLIFCAGLGEVDPPVEAGDAAPGNPPATTVNPVAVTIGGVEAEVVFSGLAPGFAGLYQINAVVPDGVSSGDAVLEVTVSGRTSPPVTLAVE